MWTWEKNIKELVQEFSHFWDYAEDLETKIHLAKHFLLRGKELGRYSIDNGNLTPDLEVFKQELRKYPKFWNEYRSVKKHFKSEDVEPHFLVRVLK